MSALALPFPRLVLPKAPRLSLPTLKEVRRFAHRMSPMGVGRFGGGGPFVVVQKVTVASSGPSFPSPATFTLPNNAIANRGLILLAGFAGGNGISSVSGGGTWRTVVSNSSANIATNGAAEIYDAVATGGATTVTVNFSGAPTFGQITLLEVAGIGVSGGNLTKDYAALNLGTGTTATPFSPLTPAQPTEFTAIVAGSLATIFHTGPLGSPWQTVGAKDLYNGIAGYLNGPIRPLTPTLTLQNSDSWMCAMVGYERA